MGLVLTEEQTLLRDSARDFIQDKSPVSAFRALRDAGNEDGYSKELWQGMAEMGWAGMLIPEEHGGLDFGFQGMGIVMEEAGRTLTASPLLASVVLGGSAIVLAGSDAQEKDILPKLATGEILLALAVDEGAHHAPERIMMSATRDGDGFVLNGEKTAVLDGHIADKVIVAARTSGTPSQPGVTPEGLTLFVVDGDAQGLTKTRRDMVDHRNSDTLTFDNVRVSADAVLGGVDEGGHLLNMVLDRGRVALAAEMLGSMSQVFQLTLDYLKERRQFGQLIGSFQSLQHRAAHMFSEIELSKSAVLAALTAIEEDKANASQLASLAKAVVNEAYHLISKEGVQMHGGIGMTDEHDIGFYLKRARVTEHALGSTKYHRARYADLSGY